MSEEKKCSFCGTTDIDHNVIIQKDNVMICSSCIEKLYHYIDSQYNLYKKTSPVQSKQIQPEPDEQEIKEQQAKEKNIGVNTTPSEIKRKLDEYVIGQEDAKKTLSIAAYNHYKRISEQADSADDVEIQKSNILMIGPTGCGKTYLAQTLSKILDVPFAIFDATGLTEAGYVGEDVDSIVARLCENADWDIEKAEHGIIYIDEIDKLARKGSGPAAYRDVGGEGVQQSLLKIIEGSEVKIQGRMIRKSNGEISECIVDTKNILFICGGAFENLEKKRKTKKKNTIGFGAEINTEEIKVNSEIQASDLIKYGMMPELVGRLPVIAVLKKLDKESIVSILTKPKNAITKQYIKLMKMDGVNIEFTPKALDKMAEEAIEKNIGARGLRSVLEKTMKDIMFTVPDLKNVKKVVVDEHTVEDGQLILFDEKDMPVTVEGGGNNG